MSLTRRRNVSANPAPGSCLLVGRFAAPGHGVPRRPRTKGRKQSQAPVDPKGGDREEIGNYAHSGAQDPRNENLVAAAPTCQVIRYHALGGEGHHP